LEKELPAAPYDLEWEKVGKGKNPKLYLPFTHIEKIIPWVFLMFHVLVFVRSISGFSIIKWIVRK